MQGTVRWYSAKGFGFIDASNSGDGEAYYFHISAVKGRSILKSGDAVTFDPTRSLKGLRAVNVCAAETKEVIPCQQQPHESVK